MIPKLLKLLKFNWRGPTSSLVMAGIASQAIVLAFTPLLSRFYSPADFGILGVFGAASNLLICVATFRYHQAIPIAKSETDSVHLAVLSLIFTGLVSGTVSLLAYFGGVAEFNSLHIGVLFPFRHLLGPALFATTAYLVFEMWCIRSGMFRTFAASRITQVVFSLTLQLSIVQYIPGPVGLLTGQIAGVVAACTLITMASINQLSCPTLAQLQTLASRFRRFPLYSTWASLLRMAALQFPMITLADYYGSAEAGWFSLSQRLVGLPTVLIAEAMGRVFLNNAAKLWHSDPDGFRRLSFKTLQKQTLAALLLAVAVVSLSPTLFWLLMGPKWANAGTYSQILCLGATLQFIVAPFEHIVDVSERQDLYAVREVLRGVLLLGVTWWATHHAFPANTAIWALSIATATVGGISLAISFYCIKFSARPAST